MYALYNERYRYDMNIYELTIRLGTISPIYCTEVIKILNKENFSRNNSQGVEYFTDTIKMMIRKDKFIRILRQNAKSCKSY